MVDRSGHCNFACTKVIKLLNKREILGNDSLQVPEYTKIDGYRHVNIFVQFSQEKSDELPVDLGVIFAFTNSGEMGARRYINFEENIVSPQKINTIDISGSNAWHGSQSKLSSYLVRFPVMAPYIQVIAYNREQIKRAISVWAYVVS